MKANLMNILVESIGQKRLIRFLPLIAISIALSFTPRLNAEVREWKDSTGSYSKTAELVSISGGFVVLKDAQGKLFAIKANRLSQNDREFLATQESKFALHSETDRTWTDAAGKQKVTATMIGFDGDNVLLLDSNDQARVIKLNLLSPADAVYASEMGRTFALQQMNSLSLNQAKQHASSDRLGLYNICQLTLKSVQNSLAVATSCLNNEGFQGLRTKNLQVSKQTLTSLPVSFRKTSAPTQQDSALVTEDEGIETPPTPEAMSQDKKDVTPSESVIQQMPPQAPHQAPLQASGATSYDPCNPCPPGCVPGYNYPHSTGYPLDSYSPIVYSQPPSAPSDWSAGTMPAPMPAPMPIPAPPMDFDGFSPNPPGEIPSIPDAPLMHTRSVVQAFQSAPQMGYSSGYDGCGSTYQYRPVCPPRQHGCLRRLIHRFRCH